MGLFRQAAGLIASKRPVSGLLKKSREIIAHQSREDRERRRGDIPLTWEEAGISPAPEDPGPRIEQKELERLLAVQAKDQTADIRKIFQEISKLPEGIEAPARLFAILKDNFHLEKAALLLYDPYRMVFAPWAASGFDRTTLRKLRLPLGFNRHFNRVAGGETLLLSDREELAEFQRCFSAREFSAMDHLAITPFIYENKLLAALLVTHTPRLATAENRQLLDEISQQAAPLIFRFREQKLESLKRDSLERPELTSERLQALLQANREKDLPVVLIKISLERITVVVTGKNPYLDVFRLQEDLAGIISTLLYDIGSVQPLGSGHLLVLVYDMAEMDSSLLLHHLELTVKSFFWELAEEESLDFLAQVKTVHGDEAEAVDAFSVFA
jgi:hypothetical protein